MSKILDTIIENKKNEIKKAKRELPFEYLINNSKVGNRSFYKALKGKNNIIAEIKFKSPSSGFFTKRSIIEIASIYDRHANAISVLTDKKFFGGKLENIMKVKEQSSLPVLRKDFILEPYQVCESRFYGADAILLIAGVLNEEELRAMLSFAHRLGMDCLVETRTETDVKKALSAGAKIIGINNRNLSSNNFEVNLETTKNLKKLIPSDKIVVSESGIFTRTDIEEVNCNAVLIGTSLMNADDIEKKLRLLKTEA